MDAKCPTCEQVIEVADTAIGRIGRCAACKGLYEVASAGRLRAVRARSDRGVGRDGSGSDADVRYKCAKCKSVLESPASLAGQQDRCPICNHVNTVPAARKPKGAKGREKDLLHKGGVQDGRSDGESVFDDASEALFDLQGADPDAQRAAGVAATPLEPVEEWSDRRRAPAPPPDTPPEPQWFYVAGGDQVGPVSFAVVRDLVRTGHLQASTMVWREGMDRWAQMGATPEFCAIPATTMAQPAPIQQWSAQYNPAPMVAAKKRAGLAVASLVCSLVGILLFGVVLGLLGIIFGGVAISKVNQSPHDYGGKGMAVAGLVIGIVDIVLGVFWLMWVFR